MNIGFETMAVLEEESQSDLLSFQQGLVYPEGSSATQHQVASSAGDGVQGAEAGTSGGRRESGKRGRRPGRKATLDKQDMKAKLERSRQSARECRARKKLRYQYLEELVADREKAVLALRKELEKYSNWCKEIDEGHLPEGIDALIQEMGIVKPENNNSGPVMYSAM